MYAEEIIVLIVGSLAVLLSPAIVLGGSVQGKVKKRRSSGR